MGQPPPELEEFCRRESLRLVGALTLYTGDVQLAEELTQETLTRVAQAWGKVRVWTPRASGRTASR